MLYWWPARIALLFFLTILVGCSTTYYDDPNFYDYPIGNRGRDVYVVSGAGGMGDGYLFHRDYFPTHYPYYHPYYRVYYQPFYY